MILFILYLIGAVLSGIMYYDCWKRKCKKNDYTFDPAEERSHAVFMGLFSWIGVIIMGIKYIEFIE